MKTPQQIEEIIGNMLEIKPENDSPYEEGGIQEWLVKHSDEHLYEDTIFGEPMCDLSKEKVIRLIHKIRQDDLEAFREMVPETQCTYDDYSWDYKIGFNTCRKELLDKLNNIK